MSFIRPLLSVGPPIAPIGPPPPPTVLSVAPTSGDFAGGTPVTITGANFKSGATVKIGGISCTGVVVVNNATITALTGPGTVALVGVASNVVVTTSVSSGTGVGLFTYTGWFQAFQIGGVNPTLFADFTTEGTTNHYFFNNAVFSSESAWLTALSGTFSRSSTAFRVNSLGNLESVSNNVLRFDFDPIALTSKGLLLESSSTNNLKTSGDIRTAGEGNGVTFWTAQATTATLSGTAPDGTSTATTITATAGTGDHERFCTSGLGAGTYTFSLFAKNGTAGFIALELIGTGDFTYFNLSNGTIGTVSAGYTATIQSFPNGWFRITVTGTTTPTNPVIMPCTANNAAFNWNAAGTETVIVWGAQIEAASFASSYISTTNAAVTRSADSLTATGNLIGNIGSAYVNVALEFTGGVIQEIYSYAVAVGTTPVVDLEALSGAWSNDAIATAGGSSLLAPSPGPVANTFIKNAQSWNQATPSHIAVAAGGTAATSSNAFDSLTTIANFKIGGGNFDTQMSGNIKQIGLWNVQGNAAQLQALTT